MPATPPLAPPGTSQGTYRRRSSPLCHPERSEGSCSKRVGQVPNLLICVGRLLRWAGLSRAESRKANSPGPCLRTSCPEWLGGAHAPPPWRSACGGLSHVVEWAGRSPRKDTLRTAGIRRAPCSPPILTIRL